MSANFFNFLSGPLIEKVISDFFPFLLLYKSGVDFTFAIVLSCTPRSGLEVIMATHHIGNFKHLTLSDRAEIEIMIEKGFSFSQMARALSKDSSTISKEIRRHRFLVPHYRDENSRRRSECAHFSSCTRQHLCGRTSCLSLCSKCRSKRCSFYCPDFSPLICPRLLKPPYVCNSCPKLRTCSHDFYFYRAKYAEDSYQEVKSSSRSGINQSPESLEKLDKLISPLLKQGQPLSHIYLTHREEINCSQRTLYNYIDLRCFSAVNLDLPRKVSYKPRKKRRSEPEIPGYRMGRTYLDFEQYIAAHPDCSIVEMDVVEGAGGKSSPVLLTLFFRSCSFMLLFLMESDCRASVRDVFDFLYASLGPARYSRLFSVILTDNGSSFKDPSVFERNNSHGSHTLIFYCDPMASWQKGRLEKNHEFIRYVLPKGKTFSGLTQAQATLIANHINSTARASLNGCTPFELALLLLDRKLLELCHMAWIPADQVTLKPTLLK